MMRVAGINIGTNLGDRSRNLRFAVGEIERLLGCSARKSSVYVTEPWGYQSDSPFFNIAIEVDTDLDGCRLLGMMQAVERAAGTGAHRDGDGRYVDRLLDIDIIYLSSEVIDTATLSVPHPRMTERAFVLVPLAEINPFWRHPLTGLTAGEMLARLPESERKGVRLFSGALRE